MQKSLKLDGSMRALAISLAGAAVMAVVGMLIPVGIFESITGATGISELVPATAAPLGDTARAIIAFLFAAGTFAVLAALLLRRSVAAPPVSVQRKPVAAPVDAGSNQHRPSLIAMARERIGAFIASRREGPVVTDLSDLPKLRPSDAHPDAPPRKPISAHADFGEVDAPEAMPISRPVAAAEVAAEPVQAVLPEPVVAAAPLAEPVAILPQLVEPAVDTSSVAVLVDRLEAGVARRQEQIARLEQLASDQLAVPSAEAYVNEIISPPPLEIVPSTVSPVGEADDMDDALRSALETLQRMNARSR
jgi:hypothetical protein